MDPLTSKSFGFEGLLEAISNEIGADVE